MNKTGDDISIAGSIHCHYQLINHSLPEDCNQLRNYSQVSTGLFIKKQQRFVFRHCRIRTEPDDAVFPITILDF